MISPGITRRGFLQGLAALAGVAITPIYFDVPTVSADLVDAPITDAEPFAWLEWKGNRYRVADADIVAFDGKWRMRLVMLDCPLEYESFFLSKQQVPIRLRIPGDSGYFQGDAQIRFMTLMFDTAMTTEMELVGRSNLQYV